MGAVRFPPSKEMAELPPISVDANLQPNFVFLEWHFQALWHLEPRCQADLRTHSQDRVMFKNYTSVDQIRCANIKAADTFHKETGIVASDAGLIGS